MGRNGEVAAFAEHARRYCAFIERAGELPLDQRLDAAREHLVHLYQAALLLPEIEPPEGIDAGSSPPRPTSWQGFEQWRFNLDVHWGKHAVDAVRALHRACSDADVGQRQ